MSYGFKCMGCQYPRRRIGSNGYVQIWAPNEPGSMAFGYAYEHRIVAEQKLGRPLTSCEHIHHVNHNKTDNRPENLEITNSRDHQVKHRGPNCNLRLPTESNPLVLCACGCGAWFPLYDDRGRPRKYIIGGHRLNHKTIKGVFR